MSRATLTPPMTPSKTPQVMQPTYDQIAKRAYEKWLKRGRPLGTHTQDWFEAENELKKEFATQAGFRS